MHSAAYHVHLHTAEAPLTALGFVVVLGRFLDGYVGQVHICEYNSSVRSVQATVSTHSTNARRFCICFVSLEYRALEKRAKPDRYIHTTRGENDVTSTYIRMSNFLPGSCNHRTGGHKP